ncbi:MAG: hypothetical protein AVDCRST_MAG49-3019, partial [uncultured Thermomicrobiales bacterium]
VRRPPGARRTTRPSSTPCGGRSARAGPTTSGLRPFDPRPGPGVAPGSGDTGGSGRAARRRGGRARDL